MTNRGFTLLELLLSVAAIALIGSISIPIYYSFQVRSDLDLVTVEFAQSLRRAQLQSLAVAGDTNWGVHISTTTITLFQGVSYASRTSSLDETFPVPESITPSGVTEIVFAAFTGTPQVTGTTTLVSNTNATRTVIINEEGTVTY